MDVRAGLGHTLVLVVSLGPGGDNHREETRSRSRAPSAMNQSSWLDAVRVDGSPEALWEDGERRFYKIWRKTTDGTRRPYTAVVPAAEHPTRDSLDRLAHEYELKDQVDAAWAVRPVELVRERGETVLVLEYHDGEPLDRLIGRPMEVGRFLRVATALSTALARLHERGLVHKDIKPANILVDPTDDRVWLLGFGVASRIPRERQSPDPPELIAGTLSHMAPEQTGRMNRSIDSRSDLYSLGVTLYQALTGSLPFTATDPLEWVHSHIARRPVPPSIRVNDLPPQLSAIIMKLLAKTPEERYQTVAGVERDLRRCLAGWETDRVIEEFSLAEYDVPDRLLIPERLYGRERETQALLAAFERVIASGKPSLVLVSGHAGIGKSSVVNELHKVLVPPRGLFASGKFDQLKRDIPYATIAQALQSLTRQLLSKPEAELRKWRDELRRALEPNGALLIDLVPELQFIIGEQPAVPEVPPADAKTRFQTALRRLIGVFARAEHPLALFLDDLQWLDDATLDLLENILVQSEPQHLLLVGAYRTNEVAATHPLIRALAVIRESDAFVQEVVLGPLDDGHLAEWLADALHCRPEQALPLARLVYEKTAGNPFFANQFLRVLADERLIVFDPHSAAWSWDVKPIQAKGYTDNVVDLIVGKLNRLSSKTLHALKGLAALGSTADTSTLAIYLEKSEEEVHSDLWEALRLELIVRSNESYRFVHDRVQEASYSLIPRALRPRAHLRIGRLLAARIREDKRDEAIFDIVGHLNRGASAIRSRKERELLAELNLTAGKRAKAAAAWGSALNYLTAAIAAMPNGGSGRRHDLRFELELHRAECEFLTGDLASAEAHLRILASLAGDVVQRAAVSCLLADLHFASQQPARAVAECLGCLRDAGLEIPADPTEAHAQAAYDRVGVRLHGLGIEDVAALPVMTDLASRALMDVMAKVAPSALYMDKNLVTVIVCTAVDLSLARGHCDSSCIAYVYLGLIAGWKFGDFEAGYRFGRLGYDLVERKGLRRVEAFVCLILSACIQPWVTHFANCRGLVRTAFAAGNRSGDRVSAVASRGELVSNLLMAGEPLVDVEKEADFGIEFCRKAAFADYAHNAAIQAAFIRSLRGLTRSLGSLDDARFDERRMEEHFATRPHLFTIECSYWIRKSHARFLAGDYTAALDASNRAQALLWSLWGPIDVAEHELFSALAHAAVCDSASPDERRRHLDAAAAHLQQLEARAQCCPENFENCAALVAAEIARVEGRDPDAMRLYERAIRSARHGGFVHNEALAIELAARFYTTRGFDRIAKAYLQDAVYGYLQWGADGKVRQLDEMHPHLQKERRRADPTRTMETTVEQLDLAAVLSVLEAVSGEIDTEALISTVMRLGVEHAGAERGLLLFPRGSGYRIEAEAAIASDAVTVTLRESVVTAEDLPESALHYVLRTRETVLVHDASAETSFSGDPYILRRRPRSVLCLPLLKQTRMVGVLYLENSLTPGVFTPSRMALLKLLASQAAISIENARLYRELEERQARFRRLMEANIIGMFVWHADGRVFDANEEFLRIIGYSREDLASARLRWTDFTLPEMREVDLRLLEDLRQGGAQKAEEREFLKKDGTRVPVLTGGTMFEGVPDEGVAFVVDLTERKRAEQALREFERESLLILDTIPGLVAVLTPSGEVDSVNQELVAFTGQPLEAMKEWGTNGTVHPDDLPHMGPIFTRAIGSGEPYDFEARIRRFDGVYRWVQIRGLPLRDSNAQVVRWYVLLADVDDRRRAEHAIDEARSELARAARVMTMSALTASIAHEVNQPLSGIITNAATCLRMLGASPPNINGARETAKRTMRDGKRAADVIARLRAMFSNREFTLEPIDLNEAIQEVVALSLGDLKRNHVTLQLELAEPLPFVMGDRVQLQQVILNLVRNASEAMADVNDRPRTLVVRTEPESDTAVRVTVRDAGVGLDDQSLDQLFDAFFTTKREGMGIGLSVSRSIVERHEGRMWAEPNDGPGATFAFSIPVRA